MAKRRRGRAFWTKLISEFKSNGVDESYAAFATRSGVRLTTFRTWLYRLRTQKAPRATRALRVLPVTVVSADRSSRELSIDCTGVALRFGADTEPARTLRRQSQSGAVVRVPDIPPP